ncbi:hypothetical protein, partial [Klebsiella pneumoniae]|uniref:hypothetical protein n=1 Tax=Klebsiella pneumoniae TaxID=573 RepID=UPI00190F82ED
MYGRMCAHPANLTTEDIRGIYADTLGCTIFRDILTGIEAAGPITPFTELPCPVTIAWGRRDRVIPFEHFGRPLLA